MSARLPDNLRTRRADIERLCRRLGVRRLELSGSGARSAPQPRDLDFIVDLGDLPPKAYADAYFSLREALEAMLESPVDLVTPANLENPYFRDRVEREKLLPYAT